MFFHRASQTLILTDTVMNLEPDKLDEPWSTAAKLSGMIHPRGQIFFGMRVPLLLQRRKAKAVFHKIRSWQPRRIVLSHGRYFEIDASNDVQRLFGP